MISILSRQAVAGIVVGLLAVVLPVRATIAQSSTVGAWSKPYKLPQVAVHAHILPSGNLLFYNDNYKNSGTLSQAHLVNIPANGAPLSTISYFNNEVNLFCAGHVFLPNGDLFVVGGQNAAYYYGIADATIFSEPAGWSHPANGRMATARWYPSVANLASGDVLALGGSITPTSHSKIPEVWQTDKGIWRTTHRRVASGQDLLLGVPGP